ncbi:hypothetical protein A1O3_07059 [Capronia epimyces CBS 606.96]|uniref:Zn(2)-C6 fungal-type domain-containing protein n=1 Tax=Capronia epimyces CBS 606.96 TaxID=1182542 RepID=W9XTV7_9EURO|nr:uncharacterized protein A1O3_07059 [Capronia epimyces CBS 606.96]EXJ80775.1 hypothetical protein A1O3_07059 [Capronia epimyces CBS 606.96]
MSDDPIRRQVQRGNRSCSECRRLKVRCIRTPPEAPTCRNCEDWDIACVQQVCSPRPIQSQRLPSGYRTAQLESEVASLRAAVRDIRRSLGYRPAVIPESTGAYPGKSLDIFHSVVVDDDDSSSSPRVSGVLAAEQPSYMRSLLHNDLLSVASPHHDQYLRDIKTITSAHLLNLSRQALQKLIPPENEISELARSSFRWLGLIYALHPLPFAFSSQQEILESYGSMHQPGVDIIDLASWLLDVSFLALQDGQGRATPATKLQNTQRATSFPRAVAYTVETMILSHDRITRIERGIVMAMRLLRLQMGMGKFEKAWLRSRHIIAVAELSGIPSISRAVHYNRANGLAVDYTQLQTAKLWELICSPDRLLAMLVNLPSGTRRFWRPTNELALVINGVVQPPTYLAYLSDFANRVQSLEDMSKAEGLGPEVYASVLELDKDMRMLASHTPRPWWTEETEPRNSGRVLQVMHFYILLRVHLPFAMRRQPNEEYFYSRLTCMDACESVVERYPFLRLAVPSGAFIARLLDLQAFVATVVLLLTSHTSPSTDRLELEVNKPRREAAIAAMFNFLEDHGSSCSSFAHHGVVTIRSLQALLQQDSNASILQQLRLKVPLLGTVLVHRNEHLAYAPPADNLEALHTGEQSSMDLMNKPLDAQNKGDSTLNHDSAWTPATQLRAEWHPNQFSWSIEENHGNLFEDSYMDKAFDQSPMWQTQIDNLPP